MNNKFEELHSFIERAVKNRKYATNTGFGLKAALKMFEKEINEEEKNSISKFRENLDAIYRSVSQRNKNITADTLEVYKRRVDKVLRDYENYGIDPTMMSSWQTKPGVVKSKKQDSKNRKDEVNDVAQESGVVLDISGTHKVELPLRTNAKFVAFVPNDFKKKEWEWIKGILDAVFIEE